MKNSWISLAAWTMAALLISPPVAAASVKDLLQSGPMIGYMEVVEALIWVQTTEPARVKIEYGLNGQWRFGDTIQTREESFLIAKSVLTDLEPDTTYEYRVWINDERVPIDRPLRFKTQTFWRYRSDPPPVRFAMGSCLYVNDEKFDRPGKPYGDDFEILDAILRAQPDFMLWLGDNLYYRETDYDTPSRLAYRNKHSRSFGPLQPLLSAMPHYAIWDDHDFGPDNSHRGYHLKREALNLFSSYWANPQFGTPELPGVFGKVTWSDLDFFLLDDRYYRAPNRLDDPDKAYFGAGQMQWLKDQLADSRASFKFVVCGNQILNLYSRHESFALYESEYRDLTHWLQNAKVSGVVFLSGDRHFSELLKVERPNNYPLYEFTSSPLTSGAGNDLGSEADSPLRVAGTSVLGKRNFGILEVSGPRKERVLKMQTYDAKGELLWEYVIQRSELTIGGKQ